MPQLSTLVKAIKGIPVVVLIGVLALVITGGVALADVTIIRGGHVSRTLTTQFEVSAGQDLELGLDEKSGTVEYVCTNPGTSDYWVQVSPTCDDGLTVEADTTSFPLLAGESQTVVLTLTFSDNATLEGDYSVKFDAVVP